MGTGNHLLLVAETIGFLDVARKKYRAISVLVSWLAALAAGELNGLEDWMMLGSSRASVW